MLEPVILFIIALGAFITLYLVNRHYNRFK